MSIGLRARILVPTAAIVGATVATVSVLASHRFRTFLEDRTVATYEATARELADAAFLAAVSHQPEDLPSFLRSLCSREEMRWLAVYGSNRDCLFAWARPGLVHPPPLGESWNAPFPEVLVLRRGFPSPHWVEIWAPVHGTGAAHLSDVAPRAAPPGDPDAGPVAAVPADATFDEWAALDLPLPSLFAEHDKDLFGVVRVGISLQSAFAHADDVAVWVGQGALLVAFTGILLTSVLSRRIAAPVHDLIRGTTAIANGEFDNRVPVPATREFALLARSLNKMATRLNLYKTQIQNQNLTLEKKVDERTQELVRAMEELRRLDKLKDEFLSNVSHELRTPMTSIRAFAEILRDYGDEDLEMRKEFLGIMVTECQRLSRLIADVLDLSKIESGTLDWSFHMLDVARTVEEVVFATQALATGADARLHFEVLGEIPLTAGDADRLKQVWTNLISNALKFTLRERNVYVRVHATDEEVSVDVQDEGPGVREEDRETIFVRFRQVASDITTEKPRGTGLGLAICKQIVERHGGRIELESKLGVGSTFRVVLPVVAPEALKETSLVEESEAVVA